MEESDFQITLYEYWKNTIRSSEVALAMLSVFEGKQVEIVDNAIVSLRTLVNQGQDYHSLIQPKDQNQQQQQQHYDYDSFDQDPSWRRVDANTFEVPLGKGTVATCIAVNTVEQLDQCIKDIYQAPYIAIDCEFLGLKKNLPELKLLQIGVSSSKGYAIQVDILGVQVITDKLKPVLEDSKLNIVGWSYRPDAMAIESYFKDIAQAAVLDLQSKLLSVAVETMNLAAAMNKYAQAWEGLGAFQNAKQFGSSFGYLHDQCIWLLNPLPPRALVYAVFDVLSVHALYKCTENLDQTEANFWPFTVLNTTSTKALDRFHRQRAKGISASPTPTASPQPPPSNKGKSPLYGSPSGARRNYKNKDKYDELPIPVSPQPETNDGYDDNDARFTLDLQKAIALSVQETKAPCRQAGESSSSSDRVVGDLVVDEYDYSQFVDSLDGAPAATGPITFAENVVDVPEEEEMAAPSWGDVNLDQQPFIGGNFRFNADAPGFVPVKKSEDTITTTTTTTTTTSTATSTVAPPSTPVAAVNTMNTPTDTTPTSQPRTVWASLENKGNEAKATPTSQPRTAWASLKDKGKDVKTAQKPSAWKTAEEYEQFKRQKTWQPIPQQQEQNSWQSFPQKEEQHSWQSFQQQQEQQSPRQQSYRTPKQSFRHSPQQPNFRSPAMNQQQRFSKPAPQSPNTYSDNYRNNNSSSRSLPSNNEYNRPKPATPSPSVPAAPLPASTPVSVSAPAPASVPASAVPSDLVPPSATSSPSAAATTTQFKCKPSKDKYNADFKLRLSKGDQTGSFTWDTGVDGNSMTAASWKNFANTTENNWKLGNDTEVDDMEKATTEAAAAAAAAKQEQRKEYKFNTVIGGHTSSQVGGPVGDTATVTMHEDDRDNWAIQEEMPDTMVMPMNQIPVRKKFSGPRVMNPDDGDYDGDDYTDDDDDDQEQEPEATKQEDRLEGLPIFDDVIYLCGEGGNGGELAVLKLTAPEHLDMIQIPPAGTPFSVTIGFHVVDGKSGGLNLKALQLYLSTGASYTCVLEQACLWNYQSKLKSTKFGQLLTNTHIKRICWYPKYIEVSMIEKLGFPLGNCIDLSMKVNHYAETLDSNSETYSFKAAVDHFLKNWPDLERYNEIKHDFEKGSASKSFSGSRWDRERLPEAVLKYSAFQGLTAYALYQLSETFGLNDNEFLYESGK